MRGRLQEHAVDVRTASGFAEPVKTEADLQVIRSALSEIDKARTEKYPNLDNLAKAVGIAPRTVHYWRDRKKPTTPKFADICKMSAAVGLTVRIQPTTAPPVMARGSSFEPPVVARELARLLGEISDPEIRASVIVRLRESAPVLIADETSKRLLALKKRKQPKT